MPSVPNDFESPFVRCPECVERHKQRALELLFEQSDMTPEELEEYRFERWEIGGYPLRQKMLDYARLFASENRPMWALGFTGESGTGKTHLVAAIAREFINRQQSVRYLIEPMWHKQNRAAIAAHTSPDEELLTTLIDVDLLIVDELMSADSKDSEYQSTNLIVLIGQRYRKKKATIVMSNHAPEQWPSRVYSRISEGKILATDGLPDYRATKRKAA